MKGLLHKSLILGVAVTVAASFNFANAKNSDKKMNDGKMWMCTTNASSSSNQSDTNADETMKKGMKSAKAAFDFAFKHCRDCTKITCDMQDNSNANNVNNTDNTTNTTN